jgi:hypothetical protein
MDEILQAKYRATFLNNPLGMDVLADILSLCHFGCTLNPDNPVQVSEYNLGVVILLRCGILAGDTFMDVVRALSSVAPNKVEPKGEITEQKVFDL